jgi:site-specific DNA recombinase
MKRNGTKSPRLETGPVVKAVRCAVYTRKSTEEGLEQEFNTLDAQREAGEAFIRSQTGEGWGLLPDRYDDGGFTGGNTERPALQRLLADIEAGKIDCVVVYKVDRLSRSLLDFAGMMQTFEKHNVSFVSVTQQFNTATSMGRLVLNVLLSFAQFEREIISERTRDKIAATRRKGKWAGGHPPPGLRYRSPAVQACDQSRRSRTGSGYLRPVPRTRITPAGSRGVGSPGMDQ